MTSSPSAEFAVDRLRPHTLDHLRYWASLTTLDNGRPWELEPFQCDIFADVFAGYREVLIVLPTGNYKSTTLGGFALYHCQFRPDARVPIGAASKGQAGIIYGQAAGFVGRSKFLEKRFRVQDGYKRIVGIQTRSLISVYSASDDTGDGIIPTLPMLDELHRHKNHDLYGTWRDKLTKTKGQMLIISTAGEDESNPLEELRAQAHRLPNITTEGRRTIARSDDLAFCMHEHALRSGDDPFDLHLVKQANPAEQITLEELRMRLESPSTKQWQWLRFTCNVLSKGESSAIQPDEFDDRATGVGDLDRLCEHYVGVDIAWKIDHAGVTPLAWVSWDHRIIHDAVTLAAPVDELQLVAAILHQHEKLNVKAFVYDPSSGATQLVQQLEKGEHILQTDDDLRAQHGLPPIADSKKTTPRFVEYSQDNAPMALAAARFDDGWAKKRILHDGAATCATPGCRCGGMRGHFLNAVQRVLGGERWRYDRPADAKGQKRAKYPIDSLSGALFANSVAVAEHEDQDPGGDAPGVEIWT